MPIDYSLETPLAKILAQQRATQTSPEPEEAPVVSAPSMQQSLMDAILAREKEESNYEKILRDKIARGPRERAEELTAKAWKDRYGVTESSGKFRRFLAGLGEVGRAIGAGKNYQSIPDAAQHAAEKEYTAEVGPLQRELGVLSQAKTAGNQLQQRMMEAAQKHDLNQAGLLLKSKLTNAQVEQALGKKLVDIAREAEIRAKTGDIQAQTLLHTIQARQLDESGGLTGEARNNWLLTKKSPDEFGKFLDTTMKNVAAVKGTESLFKTGGSGGGGRTSTRTGGSWREVGTVDNRKEFQWFPNTSTTTTGGGGAPAQTLSEKMDLLQKMTGQAASAVSAPGESPLSQVLMPPQAPPQTPVQPRVVRATDKSAPISDQVGITPPGKSDRISSNLNVYRSLGNIWHGAKFDGEGDLPPRVRQIWIGSEKAQTEQDKAREASHVLINRTTNSAIKATLEDALEWNVGLFGSIVGGYNRMRGKSAPEATKLVQEIEDNLAQYVKSISGTQVSDAEARRLKEVLANRGDNENTFLQKVIATALRTAETNWADRARLSKAERETLFSNSAVLAQTLAIEKKALEHLEAAKAAKRNNEPTYRLPGSNVTYQTAASSERISDLVTNVSRQMTNHARMLLRGSANVPPENSFRKGK